jgi:hypothetical protein
MKTIAGKDLTIFQTDSNPYSALLVSSVRTQKSHLSGRYRKVEKNLGWKVYSHFRLKTSTTFSKIRLLLQKSNSKMVLPSWMSVAICTTAPKSSSELGNSALWSIIFTWTNGKTLLGPKSGESGGFGAVLRLWSSTYKVFHIESESESLPRVAINDQNCKKSHIHGFLLGEVRLMFLMSTQITARSSSRSGQKRFIHMIEQHSVIKFLVGEGWMEIEIHQRFKYHSGRWSIQYWSRGWWPTLNPHSHP